MSVRLVRACRGRVNVHADISMPRGAKISTRALILRCFFISLSDPFRTRFLSNSGAHERQAKVKSDPRDGRAGTIVRRETSVCRFTERSS